MKIGHCLISPALILILKMYFNGAKTNSKNTTEISIWDIRDVETYSRKLLQLADEWLIHHKPKIKLLGLFNLFDKPRTKYCNFIIMVAFHAGWKFKHQASVHLLWTTGKVWCFWERCHVHSHRIWSLVKLSCTRSAEHRLWSSIHTDGELENRSHTCSDAISHLIMGLI